MALLSDVQLAGQPLGFAFAAANAVLFALYIVLAHRVARRPDISGLTGLGAAMVIAVVFVTPLGGWQVLHAIGDPVALAAGVGVGISSSVIPYVTDQLAMARLTRAAYSLMVALLPATAVVVGVIVLAQLPTAGELLAVGLVIAGVAVHRDGDPRPDATVPGEARPAARNRPAEIRRARHDSESLVGGDRLGRGLRRRRCCGGLGLGSRGGLCDRVGAGGADDPGGQRQGCPAGAAEAVTDRPKAGRGPPPRGQAQRRSARRCTRSRRWSPTGPLRNAPA